MRISLASEAPGNPGTEDNLHCAETSGHQGIAPVGRREQGDSSEKHNAQTHQRHDAHGKRAAGDDGSAVEKQPSAGKGYKVAGEKERDGEQAANDDGRNETQHKFTAGAGEERGVSAMRFGSCGRGCDGYGYESYG